MKNYNELFFGALVNGYVCPTLEGNHVSYVNDCFYVWKMDRIIIGTQTICGNIKYYDGSEIKVFHLFCSFSPQLGQRIQKILMEGKKTRLEVNRADFNFSSTLREILSRNDKSSAYYVTLIVNSLHIAEEHFQKYLMYCTMNSERLINLLLSDGSLKYTRWCKANIGSIMKLYQRFGLGDYCYRSFSDMTEAEKQGMLRYAKISLEGRDKVFLEDPFDKKIYVEREEEYEVVQREWVPEKTVREWDVLEWSSYTIPGYWEEKKEKRISHEKEELSKEQLVLARKYCLSKNIFPRYLIKEDL